MTTQELEQRIARLEERERELDKKLSRLDDMNELIQLQGRYQYLLLKQEWEQVALCFARHEPDIRMEASDSGVFVGQEGVRRFFTEHMAAIDGEPGSFAMHLAVSPHIEIAGDGKTAKSVWFCPGNFTAPSGNFGWWWGMYLVDYIKEDGIWRLWHVNASPFFATPYHKGWLDCPIQKSMRDGLEDGPPTAYNPYDRNKTVSELMSHLPPAITPYESYR